MLTNQEKYELQQEVNRVQNNYNVVLDMTLCELLIETLKEVNYDETTL